jgi:hypothetical protein
MKKIICIILILLHHIAFCEGYDILKNSTLPVGKIKEYDKKEVRGFIALFDSIYKLDQYCRLKTYDYLARYGERTDSITFHRYQDYLEHTGYFSFISDEFKRCIGEKNKLWSRHYAMQLHFSDRYGFDLMQLIERSIRKESCNENDLMNYFITYLWRKTEFKMNYLYQHSCHAVLIPNLDSGSYCKYYGYALYQYLRYCNRRDSNFAFILISHVSMKNNVFCWKDSVIRDKTSLIPDKLIRRGITFYQKVIRSVLGMNDLKNHQADSYFVLFCTHPEISGNPPYTINFGK